MVQALPGSVVKATMLRRQAVNNSTFFIITGRIRFGIQKEFWHGMGSDSDWTRSEHNGVQ